MRKLTVRPTILLYGDHLIANKLHLPIAGPQVTYAALTYKTNFHVSAALNDDELSANLVIESLECCAVWRCNQPAVSCC